MAGALTGGEIVMRAAEQRRRTGELRALAASQRAAAAEDHQAAAEDREQAARERGRALRDRQELAHQFAIAETDVLTEARTRAAGLTDLEHEVDRARRTSSPLVVAYVDVIGLKAPTTARATPPATRCCSASWRISGTTCGPMT